ncbi:uncharacterized protein FIBRA_03024 [Fibroporia radiculosa]|uniref:Galactose oxidase n=1 Tax=Fibroporia radiculosa TaxID=599839 RepID=J4I9D6_9APHY|nr:uncharacterized protein FIBRA_03024 [Fibroporia radiculosa]CCM00976.1 predicted protein [Fibroporia radiculosa]
MPPHDAKFAVDSPRVGMLSDVPEENAPGVTGRASPRSPYFHAALSGSTSTFKASASSSSLASTSITSITSPPRPPAGPRTPVPSIARPAPRSISEVSISSAIGRTPSGTRTRPGSPSTLKEKDRDRDSRDREKDRDKEKEKGKEKDKENEQDGDRDRERERTGKGPKAASTNGQPAQRIRNTPHLPHAKDAEVAPATLMYWSRAPVYGLLPPHGLRAHSVTMVDTTAWMFGGCDDKGCWRDIYHFNTETMQWAHPEVLGEIPPPCRAHTATLTDRRIVVFGGGEGPVYYNDAYLLDTTLRRWTHLVFPEGSPIPPPRRAHTAVFYKHKVWVFGGGNGMEALNDVWTLDVSVPTDKMRWEMMETRGKPPTPRGYHTANLVGSVMVVVGGSDGRECFSDVWCLNLDTLVWSQVKLDISYRRLSHTATQVGSYLFIMGGHDGSQYTSELLLFNLVSLNYEPRQIAGKPPAPRGYHVSFLADSRLFIFGGFNGNVVYDDVHLLDLAGAAYLPQVTSFRIDVE